MCEAISFIYLGINSVTLLKDEFLGQTILASTVIMLGGCIIRWISVGMPALLFICYDKINLDSNEIILIWFAGLIRGSVSAGLCMLFTEENYKLRNIVILISLFTTVFLSILSNYLTKEMGFYNVTPIEGGEWINEFVVNKYDKNSDNSTTISFKDELKNEFESRFINPLMNNPKK